MMSASAKTPAVIAGEILAAALSSPVNQLQLGGGPEKSAAAIANAYKVIFDAVNEKSGY